MRPSQLPFGHRPGLDAVRGLAILLVLLSHARLPYSDYGGAAGVTLFFVLSGFLITTLLWDEFELDDGRIAFGRFYARRALRLLPALVVFIIGFAVLLVVTGSSLRGYAAEAVASGLYLTSFIRAGGYELPHLDVTWSLSVEECFYLTWPFLLAAILTATAARRVRIGVLFGLVTLAVGWRLGCYFGTGTSWWRVYYPPDTNAYALLAGCFAAGLRRSWRFNLNASSLLAVGMGVVIGVSVVPPPWFQFGWTCVGTILVAAAGVIIVLAGDLGCPALEWRPLRALGKISYGVYLWQVPFLLLPPCAWLPWPWRGLLAMPLAISAALLSYRYVERPFLRVKREMRPVSRAAPSPRRIAI